MSPQNLGADRYVAPAEMPGDVVTTAHALTTHDGATVHGLLRVSPGATTVVVLMHPRQDLSHHVLVPELLSQGYAVYTQSTRGGLNDVSLLHEQALLDMAAGHVFLREHGFEHVVALGHSGGATLAAFYLEQAALAPSDRLDATPGGKPIPLREAQMPLADGLLLLAPHPGQGELLTRVIDASVTDEADPLSVDPSLDPYDPVNGFRPPPEPTSYDARVRGPLPRSPAGAGRTDRRPGTRAGRAVARGQRPVPRRRMRRRTGARRWPRESSWCTAPTPTYAASTSRSTPTTAPTARSSVDAPTSPTTASSASVASRLPRHGCPPGRGLPHGPTLPAAPRASPSRHCWSSSPATRPASPADAERFAAAFASSDVTHVRVPGRHFGAPLRRGMTSGATLAAAEMGHWLGARFPTGAFVSA